MTEEIEDLKKLAARERLEKLREFEARRKKEIEAAEMLLKETEEELTLETEQRKEIPTRAAIAQASQELIGVSPSGKLIWATKQFRESELEQLAMAPEGAPPSSIEEEITFQEAVEAGDQMSQAEMPVGYVTFSKASASEAYETFTSMGIPGVASTMQKAYHIASERDIGTPPEQAARLGPAWAPNIDGSPREQYASPKDAPPRKKIKYPTS